MTIESCKHIKYAHNVSNDNPPVSDVSGLLPEPLYVQHVRWCQRSADPVAVTIRELAGQFDLLDVYFFHVVAEIPGIVAVAAITADT